jgi:predicted nucleic acid-binding protein
MIGIDTTFLVQLEIQEVPEHARAHQLLREIVLDVGEELGLVPAVLTEFVHVVTDPKRFLKPLTIETAIIKARFWWNAREVRRIYPTAESTALCFDWLSKYNLGRKRLLDTQLAATLWTAGVKRIITSNSRDFSIFGVFDIIRP